MAVRLHGANFVTSSHPVAKQLRSDSVSLAKEAEGDEGSGFTPATIMSTRVSLCTYTGFGIRS